MWTLNKNMSFGLNQINGYLRRGLHFKSNVRVGLGDKTANIIKNK